MSVLLLLVPIVVVVCGGLLWPLIVETLTEGELVAGPAAPRADHRREPLAPSVSAWRCPGVHSEASLDGANEPGEPEAQEPV